MLPKPSMTYSQWVQKNFDKRFTQENAADTTPAYNENVQTYWSEYVDWAKDNPVILRKTLKLYMNDATAWIFDLFPVVKTMKDRVYASTIEIPLDIPDVGTRKVPGRNIWSKVSRREEHTLYRSQGFTKDYTHMKTPDGQREWDMFVDAVTSNIWSAIILDALNEFRMQPTAYFSPEHLWSFVGMPTTPEQVFQRKAAMFGVYNRTPQAHSDINAMVSRIFEQNRLTLSQWIMTRGDLYRIGLQDETNKYADKSGTATALRTRRDGAMIQSIQGNRVYVIPLLEGKQYNDHDEWVLQSEHQTGSKAEFPAYGPDDDAFKFRSRQRDIEFCSWTTNTWDTYRLSDFLDHCLEFIPPRAGQSFEESGVINRELLGDLAADAKDGRAFTRVKCAVDGNQRRVNPLIGYFPHTQDYYPLEVFGEIDDAFNHTDEYPWAAETLQNAMFKDFTQDDMRDFTEGLDFVKSLKNVAKSGGDTLYGIDGMLRNAVRATADVFARGTDMDDPGYLGCWMLPPNKFGFIDATVANWGTATLQGFGHISAMLWMADQINTGRAPANDTVTKFVRLYERVIKNLKQCCPDHPAIDPRLVPLYHNSSEMNDFTRSMIVAWYSIFDSFTPPIVIGGGGAAAAPAVEGDKVKHDGGEGGDNPFLAMSGDLVTGFLGHFTAVTRGATPDEAATKTLASNIGTLLSAAETLGKLPEGTDAAGRKREKLLASVQKYIPEYVLEAGQAENFLRWLSTGDNARDIERVLEARCRAREVVGTLVDTYDELRTVTQVANRDGAGDPTRDAGEVTPKRITIVPLVYTHQALTTENVVGHPEMMSVSDHSNTYTGMRAHVDGIRDHSAAGDACGSVFDPEDVYSYGGTLGTALPFVHPHYPFLPRSGDTGDALMRHGTSGIAVGKKARSVRYRDGFPAARVRSQEEAQFGYDELQRRMFKSPDSFGDAQGAFPNLNRVMVQSIVAPFCGHPQYDDLTHFELRWVKSHDLGVMHGIAQRAYLLAPCRSSTFHGFDRCNVEIMFGGDVMRPFEGQIMHHQIALAGGAVGTTYMSGMDNTIGFRQLSQDFVIQAFIDHKAMIERIDAYYIAEATRGGIAIGGKGNRWNNEGVQVYPNDNARSATVHERFGDSSLMGDSSVIASLAGYNHARRPFKSNHWDARGNWKIGDFVNDLHESHEFLEVRPFPMYDGQFVINYVYGSSIRYEPPRKDVSKMSFQDKTVLRRMNYHVHQTTQRCNGGAKTIKSHHLWGDQLPGLSTLEQGLTTTKLLS